MPTREVIDTSTGGVLARYYPNPKYTLDIDLCNGTEIRNLQIPRKLVGGLAFRVTIEIESDL